MKQRYLANDNVALKLVDPRSDPTRSLKSAIEISKALGDPFYPRFWERLKDIERGYHCEFFGEFAARPRGIFICDMGELFGDWVPRKWQDKVFKAINDWDNRNDRFYLLTKQPQNLIKFNPFPDNCWVGVTATNREQYLIATGCKGLDGIEAKVKYISFEPLLEQIGASDYRLKGINWVIIGAQTKPTVYPKIEWVEEIVRACDKAGVKVFLKNNLWGLIPPVNGILGQYKQNQAGINFYLRQEMPGV